MRKPFDCPRCGKCFTTKLGAQMHIDAVHGADAAKARKRPKPPKPPEREMSLAEIAVEAHLKRAMGDELDPLEESLINF